MATKFLSVPTKRLAVSINASSTTLQLSDVLGWDGVALTPTIIGDKLYATLRNPQGTLLEIIQLDPTSLSGTTFTILLRGMKFEGDLSTEVTGNKLSWTKGDTIVELGTDTPQLLNNLVRIVDAQTIAGIKTFSSLPATTAGNPVADNDLARKLYVDTVVGGIATTINVIVPGTAGETLVAGNLIYFDDTDNEWKKCDADTAATVENTLLGIAQGAGSDGVAITAGVLIRGLDANQSGLTAGAIYYASNTAGGLSASAGTVEVTIGFAYSATQFYFNPRFNQQLTEDQQDALAGTSGTPASGNKFVTNDDVAAAATASKVARRNATGDITVPTTPSANEDAASKSYVDTFLNIYKNGTTSYDLATASGTQTIAHGLGVTPKFIRITAISNQNSATEASIDSVGVYNGTTNSNIHRGILASTQTYKSSSDNTNIVAIVVDYSGGIEVGQKAVATFNATNITLTWTKAGTPTGTVYFMWEAFA